MSRWSQKNHFTVLIVSDERLFPTSKRQAKNEYL